MTKKREKLNTLYSYLLKEGFSHSIDEIAIGIGVTPTTLYNRYQTRKGLEESIIQFWIEEISIRINEKRQYANNSIEEILYFIHEIYNTTIEETHFYEKACQIGEIEKLKDCLISIIEKGIEQKNFTPEGISTEYLTYFIHTLLFSIFKESPIESQYIIYILTPILTIKGKETLQEIDLSTFFTKHNHVFDL